MKNTSPKKRDRHLGRYSASLFTREIKIKIARYPHTPIGMEIKTLTLSSASKEKLQLSYIAGEHAKMVCHSGK